MIDFNKYKAASYRGKTSSFKAITNFDLISIDELLFLDDKFEVLAKNTKNFLDGKFYQHCLLGGAKGCGKTSLIKAIFNEFKDSNLRIIEVFKDDLKDLRYIIDELENEPFKFIIFLDDFSFDVKDDAFKVLKPIIDGGIEKLSDNIMFIASSNYKNILKSSNHNYSDADFLDEMDDKFSLKERFGIWLTFYAMSQAEYLAIIDKLFKKQSEEIHKSAIEFANLKAARSGRIAKQFYELNKDNL